jgi:hypothetical protein
MAGRRLERGLVPRQQVSHGGNAPSAQKGPRIGLAACVNAGLYRSACLAYTICFERDTAGLATIWIVPCSV